MAVVEDTEKSIVEQLDKAEELTPCIVITCVCLFATFVKRYCMLLSCIVFYHNFMMVY